MTHFSQSLQPLEFAVEEYGILSGTGRGDWEEVLHAHPEGYECGHVVQSEPAVANAKDDVDVRPSLDQLHSDFEVEEGLEPATPPVKVKPASQARTSTPLSLGGDDESESGDEDGDDGGEPQRLKYRYVYNTKTGTMLTYEPPFPEPTFDYDIKCVRKYLLAHKDIAVTTTLHTCTVITLSPPPHTTPPQLRVLRERVRRQRFFEQRFRSRGAVTAGDWLGGRQPGHRHFQPPLSLSAMHSRPRWRRYRIDQQAVRRQELS